MEPKQVQPTPEEEAPQKTLGQKILSVFEIVFWSVAIVAFFVMVYFNTAKEKEISPFLPPTLFLLFGCGIGGGILFRSIVHRSDNVSPINFFFKIAVAILILLSVLLSFLLSLLKLL